MAQLKKLNHFDNGKCWNCLDSDSGGCVWVIHFSFQRHKHPSTIQRQSLQAFARAAVLFHRPGSVKVDERRSVSREESCWKAKCFLLPFAISHVACRALTLLLELQYRHLNLARVEL